MPGEGRVNPFKMNLNMASKAKSLARISFTHTPVTNLRIENGLVRALETPRGEIKADLFTSPTAPGRGNSPVFRARYPILFERGEAMVSMQVAPRVKRMITDGALFNQSPTDHPW